MALLRGKLFAGALFAGALFGDPDVAPQPPLEAPTISQGSGAGGGGPRTVYDDGIKFGQQLVDTLNRTRNSDDDDILIIINVLIEEGIL